LVLLLALSAAKTDGWRVPAASAAVGSVTLGAVAIMAGEAPAGFDTGWAIAAIVWGVLAGVVATCGNDRAVATEDGGTDAAEPRRSRAGGCRWSVGATDVKR
jgi:hypothetical protein